MMVSAALIADAERAMRELQPCMVCQRREPAATHQDCASPACPWRDAQNYGASDYEQEIAHARSRWL